MACVGRQLLTQAKPNPEIGGKQVSEKASYTISKKVYKLSPLKGRVARRTVPYIMEVVAGLINVSAITNFDVLALFNKDAPAPSFSAFTEVAYSLSVFLKDRYDEVEERIFPLLLCLGAEQWEDVSENSTLGDLYKAVWVAIRYHLETSFGVDVQEALKNLQAEPEEAPGVEVEVEMPQEIM